MTDQQAVLIACVSLGMIAASVICVYVGFIVGYRLGFKIGREVEGKSTRNT